MKSAVIRITKEITVPVSDAEAEDLEAGDGTQWVLHNLTKREVYPFGVKEIYNLVRLNDGP